MSCMAERVLILQTFPDGGSSCACMNHSKYLNVEYLTFRAMQSWSHLEEVSNGNDVGFTMSLANMDLHFRKPAYTGGRF